MPPKTVKKLYYSISEVSEMTGIKQYVLRYWESEFPELRPSKNRAGNRIYRDKDIEMIKQIRRLLYVDKYTIEGARQQLKEMEEAATNVKADPGAQMHFAFDKNRSLTIIKNIQKEMKHIVAILDGK